MLSNPFATTSFELVSKAPCLAFFFNLSLREESETTANMASARESAVGGTRKPFSPFLIVSLRTARSLATTGEPEESDSITVNGDISDKLGSTRQSAPEYRPGSNWRGTDPRNRVDDSSPRLSVNFINDSLSTPSPAITRLTGGWDFAIARRRVPTPFRGSSLPTKRM